MDHLLSKEELCYRACCLVLRVYGRMDLKKVTSVNVYSEEQYSFLSGGEGGVDPPVPIPNTEVKHTSAEGTWGATPWEMRSLPGSVGL